MNGVNSSTFAGAGVLVILGDARAWFPLSGTLRVQTSSGIATITYTARTAITPVGTSTFTGCTTTAGGGGMFVNAGVSPDARSVVSLDNPTAAFVASTLTLTDSSKGTGSFPPFAPADVGKTIVVMGACASATSPMATQTTIASFVNTTTVTVAPQPSIQNSPGCAYFYGTDDTAALAASLTAAAGQPSSTVDLGGRAYLVVNTAANPLTIPSNCLLTGNGGSIRQSDSSAPQPRAIFAPTALVKNTTVADISLIHTAEVCSSPSGGSDSIVTTGGGIGAATGEGVTFRGVTFSGGLVQLGSGSTGQVQNVTFDGCHWPRHGVQYQVVGAIADTSTNSTRGLQILNCTGLGTGPLLEDTGGAANVGLTVSGNSFPRIRLLSNLAALSVRNYTNVIISNNDFSGTTCTVDSSVIAVSGSTQVLISGNNCSNARSTIGAYLKVCGVDTSAEVIIDGNNFSGMDPNGGSGSPCYLRASSLIVSNNDIQSTVASDAAIAIRAPDVGTIADILIAGNLVRNNGGFEGLVIAGFPGSGVERVKVTGNVFRDNSHGVLVRGTVVDLDISSNLFIDNTADAWADDLAYGGQQRVAFIGNTLINSTTGVETIYALSASTDRVVIANNMLVAAAGGSFTSTDSGATNKSEVGTMVDVTGPVLTTLPTVLWSRAASSVPLTVKAAIAQTSDLQQWIDAGSNTPFRVDAKGDLHLGASSSTFARIGFKPNGVANEQLIQGEGSTFQGIGVFDTGAYQWRLTSHANGNLGVNTHDQFATGLGVIGIVNAITAPNAALPPTNGGVLFVQAGALKYLGSSGTVTIIAPA